MKSEKSDNTRAWMLYEEGKRYNNELVPNQYNLVNSNVEFFAGNQWLHLPSSKAMASLPKPVFNIIKRIVSAFVASMTSSSTRISFEPLSYVKSEDFEDENLRIADVANREIENLWEKMKLDFRIRDALFDGAITGDYCCHFFWNPEKKPYGNSVGKLGEVKGEIEMEMVDGINVMFGNPNNRCVEDQPYILIIGRDTVENLQDEYNYYHKSGNDVVVADYDNTFQAGIGGKVELTGDKTGKALFIYLYEKKKVKQKKVDVDGNPVMEVVYGKDGEPVVEVDENGSPIYGTDGMPIYKRRQAEEEVETVHVSKCTQNVDIYTQINTGLTYYPIAWGNWETQKNQYHGRALVTGIIPNQIFINTMFALVMRHLQNLGFPKIIYNRDILPNYSNAVGEAIGIKGLPPNMGVNSAVTTVRAADMSGQIIQAIDKAMEYTKECLGATDAQLGNVRAENTSALIALQNASAVPLENPRSNLYEWVEDIGRILLDMMGTYYGVRPLAVPAVINSTTGVSDTVGMPMLKEVKIVGVTDFDFSKLKHMWLRVKADVGASAYWSKLAMVQTLDNLKADGTLDIIQYLERMPSEFIPKKDELIADIKKKMGMAQVGSTLAPTGGNGQGVGGERGGAALIGNLSGQSQKQINARELSPMSERALYSQSEATSGIKSE